MEEMVIKAPGTVVKHKAWTQFLQFHIENKELLREIISILDVAKQAGVERTSVKAIINYLRFNFMIKNPGKPYKINDQYTGIYTHLIIYNWPQYAVMLETRRLRAVCE